MLDQRLAAPAEFIRAAQAQVDSRNNRIAEEG